MTRKNHITRLSGDQKKSGNVRAILLALDRAEQIFRMIADHYENQFYTKEPPKKIGSEHINIDTIVNFLEDLHINPDDLFNKEYYIDVNLNKYQVHPESVKLDHTTLGERIRYLLTEKPHMKKDDNPTTTQSPFAPSQTYKLIGKIDLG